MMSIRDRVRELRAAHGSRFERWTRWVYPVLLVATAVLVCSTATILERHIESDIRTAHDARDRDAAYRATIAALELRIGRIENRPAERPQIFVLQTDGFQELKESPK